MSKTTPVALPAPDLALIDIPIRGLSPLIVHRWSEKAKNQMLAVQTKRASKGKEAKNPQEMYRDSLYMHPKGGYGFPALAFKAAAVRAGTYADMKMTYIRGAFHVLGEMVKIEGEPRMREDMVRIGMGVADLRYRGEFPEWQARIPVRVNTRAISVEQVVNLFEVAGFSVGVGEWRPERDGSYGMFEVVR